MPLAQPLETLRKELEAQLVDDLAAALKSLQTLLPEKSEKYGLVIVLLGRLNDANEARMRDTLADDDLQRKYNRIRADLLDLVQGLEEADFDPVAVSSSAATAKIAAVRQGSVLYRIPNVMPLEKETRCVVRIALDKDAIVENISLDEHVELKSLYRVSDTMQAEILDPSGGQQFNIRSTSDPVQIIDEQGYTEWRFYVTPHMEGSHPLEVKVSIIETKNGLPAKKEIVLEEIVQVVTENTAAPDDDGGPMKTAGYALAFLAAAPHKAGKSAPVKPSIARGGSRALQAIRILAATIAVGTTGALIFTTPEWRACMITRHLKSSPRAYREYIEKYPNSACAKEFSENLQPLISERDTTTPLTTTTTTTDTPSTPIPPVKQPEMPATEPLKPAMIFVQGGRFQMGSDSGESNEMPVHPVILSDFYIGQYEVTYDEYDRFCETTRRKKPAGKGWGRGKHPVTNVSWLDAVEYCNWLSLQQGLKPAYRISGGRVTFSPNTKGYRLPTEAEWEYAARGGKKSRGYEYSGGNNANELAWFEGNSNGKPHKVGSQKKSNELNLYDMSGNVWEWCSEWYGEKYYASSPLNNPAGPGSGEYRVIRGGSWMHPSHAVTFRNPQEVSNRADCIGFRLARSY